MKVFMMLIQVDSEGHALHKMGGEILTETFNNIKEAADWIDSYLDWKAGFLGDMKLPYIRNGNTLTWEAMNIRFIETYDIAF